MAFIQTDNSPASALSTLGAALFPDPSRMIAAQSAAATARHSDQQTRDLQEAARQRALIPGLLQQAQRAPTPENTAALIAAGEGAGMKLSDIVGGQLAANALGGAGALPATTADRVSALSGGQTYTSTQTGQSAALANQIQQTRIQTGPQYEAQALDRQKYANERNAYTDANGNTVYMAPGQTPGPTFQPTVNQNAITTAEIGARASNRTADLAANKQTGYVVPDPNAPSGRTTTYRRADEAVPDGAVPLDAQNPSATGLGSYLFSGPTPALPAPPAPGSTTVNLGPGRLSATIAGGPSAAAAAPAPAAQGPGMGGAAPVLPNGTPLPGQASPEVFGDLYRNHVASLNKQDNESAKDQGPLDAALAERVKAYNAENNGGMSMTGDYQLSDAAKAAVQTRASQLATDRTNRTTFNKMPEAINQAWQELSPQFKQDGHWFNKVQGPSFLRLKSEGPGAPAGAARGGAGTPNTTTPPAPPNPMAGGGVPSGASAGGPAGGLGSIFAPPAAAAPAAPAAPRAAPPDPSQRIAGQTYITGRGPLVWAGTGWKAP